MSASRRVCGWSRCDGAELAEGAGKLVHKLACAKSKEDIPGLGESALKSDLFSLAGDQIANFGWSLDRSRSFQQYRALRPAWGRLAGR